MATITGRFGAVQRLLPSKRTIVGSGATSSSDIEIYGWNGFTYQRVNGKDSVIAWDVLTRAGASTRTTVKARMEASGKEPANADTDLTYSNMVSTVQSWSLDLNAATQTYTASNFLGYNAKYAGVKSCSGSFTGVGAFPPVKPGDRFLFLGFTGPENGIDKISDTLDNKKGYVYQIAAVVTNITISINYGTFAPITWQVQWQSDYKNPGDEFWVVGTPLDDIGFYDDTAPPCGEAMPSRNYTLEIAPNKECVNDIVKACLESANITFNTTTTQVANSCSAAAGGWQTSTVGVTDVTINTTIHESSFGVFDNFTDSELANIDVTNGYDATHIQERSKKFYPGMDRYVRVYLGDYYTGGEPNKNACGAWEFNKLYVGSFTGLNVDIAGGGVLSFNTTLEFNASPKKYKITNGTCTDEIEGCESGYIKYRLPNNERTTDTNWESFLNLADYKTTTFLNRTSMTGRSTADNAKETSTTP